MPLIVILEVLIKFIRRLYLGLPPYMDTLVRYRYLMMVQRATEAGCYVGTDNHSRYGQLDCHSGSVTF